MLPPPATLTVFLVSAIVVLVIPGPAVLFIVAHSIDGGRRAGLICTAGIGLGTLIHVVAAAIGISALLVSSAAAFTTVKYLGAAYLVWLGVRKLLAAQRGDLHDEPPSLRTGQLFRDGLMVNLLNPKAALFFFAFLPQFVDPQRGQMSLQVLSLGGLFLVLAVSSDTLWALLASSVGQWLRRSKAFVRWRERLTGGTFIALGLAAAFGGRASN